MIRTLGIGATLALLVIVAGAQPANAACGNSYLISALQPGPGQAGDGGFIVSNPDFALPYGAPGCYTSGCYGQAAFSPNFQANFWGLTVGDPAIGVGADNGALPLDSWIYGSPPYVGGGGTYYYYRQLFTNWAASAEIDGCVADAGTVPGSIDGNECTCILMNDQWNGEGYFALLGRRVDATSNFWFDDPAQVGFRLAPMPKVNLLASTRDASNNITFTVDVQPTAGIYDPDGCGCAMGYRVVAAVVPRGSQPPTDRSTGWTPLDLAVGGAQDVTPLGASVDVVSLCGATDTDVYLAAELVGDSGFVTSNVSGNSTRVECGPNLADPIRPVRVPRGRPVQVGERSQGGRGK